MPSTIGTKSCFADSWMAKMNESGWRRRSDPIGACVPRQKPVAQPLRLLERETRQRHLGVLRARGVDGELAESVAAHQRPLRYVEVLHPRTRHGDRLAKDDAALDFNQFVVDAITRVAVFEWRP